MDMVVNLNKLFDENEYIYRSLRLVSHRKPNGNEQFSITVPADFVSVCGWKKGEVLNASLILGSGLICVEKAHKSGGRKNN